MCVLAILHMLWRPGYFHAHACASMCPQIKRYSTVKLMFLDTLSIGNDWFYSICMNGFGNMWEHPVLKSKPVDASWDPPKYYINSLPIRAMNCVRSINKHPLQLQEAFLCRCRLWALGCRTYTSEFGTSSTRTASLWSRSYSRTTRNPTPSGPFIPRWRSSR